MDGVDVTDQPLNSFALGKVAPVPVIIVSTATDACISMATMLYLCAGDYI